MAKITQPTIDAERTLNSIIDNLPDEAYIGKKKYRIKWLRPITTRKITELVLKEGNDHNVSHKAAAVIVLNDLWKIWLFYPILWRWFYYVKQYTEDDLTQVIALGKKKIPLQQYYVNTILMTDMKDTTMTMKKEEVYSIRQGQTTAQAGSSQKSTTG